MFPKPKFKFEKVLKINTQTQKSPWMQLHLKQKDEYIVQPFFQHRLMLFDSRDGYTIEKFEFFLP